jgi:ACS family sodium-dependent inorganic phosphate cotransporter
MQSIGFLGPAFFLSQLSHIDSPALAVLCMACSQVRVPLAFLLTYILSSSNNTFFSESSPKFQGTDAFSQSGLYSNHQDIGPRYAVNISFVT